MERLDLVLDSIAWASGCRASKDVDAQSEVLALRRKLVPLEAGGGYLSTGASQPLVEARIWFVAWNVLMGVSSLPGCPPS